MPVQNQRSQDIDILRCFGITLMVAGHIYFGEIFDIFIHAFHMPMFFIISGMFFRIKADTSLRDFAAKKAKSLLIPYLVFGILYYLVWPTTPLFSSNPSKIPLILNQLFYDNTQSLANWFLTALFLSDVIYFLLLRSLEGKKTLHIAVVAVAFLGCTIRKHLPFPLPWAMDSAFVGVGFMHIGRLLYQSRQAIAKRLLNLKLTDVCLIGIVTTASIFWNGYVNMRQGIYGFLPLFWINSTLATLCGLGLAQYTVKWAPKQLCTLLAEIGKNSIVFLCLNQLVLLFVGKLLNLVDLPASRLFQLVISMLLMHGIAKVLSHPRLKFMIGK